MFWHRRKLLEIEEQLKGILSQLDEAISSGFDKISKENDSLQHSLCQIEDGMLKLEQGQGKMLELLTSLAGEQNAGQEKIVSMVKAQRDPMIKLLDMIGDQNDCVRKLDEAITEGRASLRQNQQECTALNEKILRALDGTEHTITKKVVDQGALALESHSNSTRVLAEAIAEVLTSLNRGQQNSVQFGDQVMETLQGIECAIIARVTQHATTVKDSLSGLQQELSDQGGAIHEIDTRVEKVSSGMYTLDEAMRLLLVNTLLNNFPGK